MTLVIRVVSPVTEPDAWSTFLTWTAEKLLGPLVAGAVIAILGSWLLAQANERYRSRREHLAKAVDGLRTQVEALLKVASAYWSAGVSDESAAQEAEIDFRLDEIHGLMEVSGWELFQTERAVGPELFSKLVSAVVAETYATPNRTADTARPRKIAAAASALSNQILKQRGHYFGSGRPLTLIERAAQTWATIPAWWAKYDVAALLTLIVASAAIGVVTTLFFVALS